MDHDGFTGAICAHLGRPQAAFELHSPLPPADEGAGVRGVLARLRAQIVREFGILQPAWGHGGDDLPGQPPARVPHADDDGDRGALRFDPAPKSDGKVADETDGRVVYSAVPAARRGVLPEHQLLPLRVHGRTETDQCGVGGRA